MARALRLGRNMRGHVWPNPPVGCVILRGRSIVAEAHTQPGGRPHAEAVALARAGRAARGATLYVTLEPCCHWGRTPPCTDAIIAAGVARVVAALQDPDPRVDGGGFARLRAAGIAVTVGEGAAEATTIMSGFLHRIRTGRPEVIALETSRATVPQGVDALMYPTPAGAEVRLRSGQVVSLAETGDALLDRLGRLGLTSVAVQRDPMRPAQPTPGAAAWSGNAVGPSAPDSSAGASDQTTTTLR